jgi:hypothetical protein
MVTVILVQSWNHEALLLRFLATLCASPLVTTLLALQTSKESIDAAHLLQLGLVVTFLLVVAAYALYQSPQDIATRCPIVVDLPCLTLVTLALVHAYEVFKIISTGVDGYLGDSVTLDEPSVALLPYLAVDQATLCVLVVLVLGYYSQKRVFLVCYAFLQLANLHLLLPQVSEALVLKDYYESLYMGTAMFSLTAAIVGQDVVFWREPVEEQDKQD